MTDLNGDAMPDAVVYVYDREFCGSGGCVLGIFRGTRHGFRKVSGMTIVQPPIAVSRHRTNGWRDLLLGTGGMSTRVMRFDGRRYPGNPSVQAAARRTDLQRADTLKALDWPPRPSPRP